MKRLHSSAVIAILAIYLCFLIWVVRVDAMNLGASPGTLLHSPILVRCATIRLTERSSALSSCKSSQTRRPVFPLRSMSRAEASTRVSSVNAAN